MLIGLIPAGIFLSYAQGWLRENYGLQGMFGLLVATPIFAVIGLLGVVLTGYVLHRLSQLLSRRERGAL